MSLIEEHEKESAYSTFPLNPRGQYGHHCRIGFSPDGKDVPEPDRPLRVFTLFWFGLWCHCPPEYGTRS
jgi:hypothetical protein